MRTHLWHFAFQSMRSSSRTHVAPGTREVDRECNRRTNALARASRGELCASPIRTRRIHVPRSRARNASPDRSRRKSPRHDPWIQNRNSGSRARGEALCPDFTSKRNPDPKRRRPPGFSRGGLRSRHIDACLAAYEPSSGLPRSRETRSVSPQKYSLFPDLGPRCPSPHELTDASNTIPAACSKARWKVRSVTRKIDMWKLSGEEYLALTTFARKKSPFFGFSSFRRFVAAS